MNLTPIKVLIWMNNEKKYLLDLEGLRCEECIMQIAESVIRRSRPFSICIILQIIRSLAQ